MSVEADLVVQHGNLKCSSSPVAVTGRSVLAQPDHEPHIQLQHLQSIMNSSTSHVMCATIPPHHHECVSRKTSTSHGDV